MIRTLALGLVLLLPAAAHAQPADGGAQSDLELLSRADAARQFVADTTRPTVVEFSDYACSTCAAFDEQRGDSLMTLHREGGVNLVFRAFPIPRLLRGFQGAEAAFCAGALGGPEAFLSVHHALFRERTRWAQKADAQADFVRYAEEAGLYIPDFRACLARDAMAPLILSDVGLAQTIDLRGTPTFVISRPGRDDYEKYYGNVRIAQIEEGVAIVEE